MTEQKALWGWYPAGNTWVKLQVSATGKLVIDPTALFENPPTNGEDEKAPQSDWAYDHWKDPYAHQDTGGKCGINVATLTGGITLTPYVDKIYQVLKTGGVSRTITLDTASAVAGDRFVIKHDDASTSTFYLIVQQGMTLIERFWANAKKAFIYDGTNWVGIDMATGETIDDSQNLAFGHQAIAYDRGFAFGSIADGHGSGFALGIQSNGYNSSVAIGTFANATLRCIAIGSGAGAAAKAYSIALGYYSECAREGETAISINGASPNTGVYTQGRFFRDTVNDTPVEIWCRGDSGSRFTIKAKSALAFRITVSARDNVAGDVAMFTFEGVIKRDAANNTVMVVCNKTRIDAGDAGGVPSGLIAMWHGTIANIPAGWKICDGNNGTPNLLASFVEGVATAATDPGATGGAFAKTTAGHVHSLPLSVSLGSLGFGYGSYFSNPNSGSQTDSIADIRPPYYDVAFLMKDIIAHQPWDCNVTADDVNEALIITVTGDATNPTRWAAVLEGVEVIF